VDEDIVSNIRSRVERCRRLAASTTDRQVAAVLLQMAQEGEADIEQLTAEAGRQDDSPDAA